jgi:ATP-dependent Clp protease, protease subunit
MSLDPSATKPKRPRAKATGNAVVEREDLERLLLARKIEAVELDIVKKRDDLDSLVNSNARCHVYTFAAAVTTSSVAMATHVISEWWRNDPETPIEIIISSPGGYVFDGFGFYDFLRDLVKQGADVTTRASGYAASMAGILLQAGSTRAISPNSYVMIHEVGGEAWGKMSEVRDEVDLMDRLEKSCFEILAARSKFTVDELREKCKRKDWWINAREAKRYGFVDVIR